jgi:pyruvate,water dikinase
MSARPIAWFADIGLADRLRVGGKGASLGEIIRAGGAAPPGFVVATGAFERFLHAFDPAGETRRRIAAIDPSDHASLATVCADVRSAILDARLPDDLVGDITEAYRALGDGADAPVAVRSSATSEDSADASFAGLQDTFLWIVGADGVVDAVKRCWASLYSVESVGYRLRLKLPEDDVAMAVVVQRMVDARCAGVMFTRSPLTGDKSVIVIEGAWGLGSAVVGGEVTPDRFVVNKITGEIKQRTVSRKALQHVPDAARGAVAALDVPQERQSVACLSDVEIALLAATGRMIEKHYGCPQDIEWAFDQSADAPWLLQARPETVWSAREREKKAIVEAKANPMAHVLSALANRTPGR